MHLACGMEFAEFTMGFCNKLLRSLALPSCIKTAAKIQRIKIKMNQNYQYQLSIFQFNNKSVNSIRHIQIS